MGDPCSTTRDLLDFTGNLEDAFRRSNADKESARKILDAKPVACKTKSEDDDPYQGILDIIQEYTPTMMQARIPSLRLQYTDGLCSGTAVHPHTLLTATHCMDGGKLVTSNVQPIKALAQVDDGNDHTLVTVDVTFPVYAKIVQRKPVQGEEIHYWGNPMGFSDVYRKGYVGGYCNVPDVCMDVSPTVIRSGPLKGEAYMLILPGAPGDSGAGVFDTGGTVIGVVSAIQVIGGSLAIMEGLPLAFPPATLAAMK